MSSKRGCGILFFRKAEKAVLLFRRDDKPTISFPNHLDILGGSVEDSETPEQAIVREMAEELYDLRTGSPYSLKDFRLLRVYRDERGTQQHIFYREADFDIEDVRLNEGQELVWFRESELRSTPLAFGFETVVQEFFAHFPRAWSSSDPASVCG